MSHATPNFGDVKPDAYSTHLPTLVAAVMQTTGPVLELGCGFYSTPVLHELCRPTKRRCVTVESAGAWVEAFRDRYETPWHRFVAGEFPTVLDHPELVLRFSVVLIDHAPPWRGAVMDRWAAVQVLGDRTDAFLLHDAEQPGLYGYQLDTNRYGTVKRDDCPWGPMTVVLDRAADVELGLHERQKDGQP